MASVGPRKRVWLGTRAFWASATRTEAARNAAAVKPASPAR
jgi:hypothetical protein